MFEYHEKYAVNESVCQAFTFGEFRKDAFLHSTDNGYERLLDEDGTAGTLAVGHSRLSTEYRKPKLFLRAVVVAVEVFDPC